MLIYILLAGFANVALVTNSSLSSTDPTITAAPSIASIGPPACHSYDLDRNCGRSGDPYFSSYMGFNNPYYDYEYLQYMLYVVTSTSLLDYCVTLWDNSFSQWEKTAAVTSLSLIPATTSSLYSDVVYTYASWWSVSYVSDFPPYTASAPCCALCTLYGGNVQVYYWPTTTESPLISTLVNEAGFTFVSPSVYVAFESLYATDFCGTFGSVVTATTLAFAPGELSTDIAYHYSSPSPFIISVWKSADWGNAKTCSDVTISFWQWEDYKGTALTVYEDYANNTMYTWYTATYNPCLPTLSVPTQMFTIDPNWSTCVTGIGGLYDPPYILSAGNGLVAFATSTAPATSATDLPEKMAISTAAAGQTIMPNTATSTVATTAPTTRVASLDSPVASPTTDDPPTQTPNGDPTTSSTPDDPPAQSPNTGPPAASTTTKDAPASSPAASLDSDPAASSPPTNPKISSSPSRQTQPADPATTIIDPADPASPLTINSQSQIIIASQTLTPGGQVTNSGTTYSLASNGGTLAIADASGSRTQTVLIPQIAPTMDPSYTIGTQTLAAGKAPITISGSAVSLLPGGSSVIFGSSTQALSAFLAESIDTDAAYLVGGKTLVAGASAIAVLGEFVSLDVGGQTVVVAGPSGKITEPLSDFLGPSTTIATPGIGLGGVIQSMGGFVAESGTSTSEVSGMAATGVELFTGGGTKVRSPSHTMMTGLLVGIGVLYVCII